MKRLNFILAQARRMTNNEDPSEDDGIQDSELIPYVNAGQDRIFGKIVTLHPGLFEKEAEIDSVSGQEVYDLPRDCFLSNKITGIEYSSTGDAEDYYPLEKRYKINRDSGSNGLPGCYILKSGQFIANPIPQDSSGKFRVSYIRDIQHLDLRRGKVSAVTLNSSTKTITSLTLDVADTNHDQDTLDENDYICIVDKDGVLQMADIDYSAVNSSTGAVTVDSSFVYLTGEEITVGDYVVVNKNTSTHSELPRTCERYLIEYLAKKINHRDSSDDFLVSLKELKDMEDDIVDSFAEVDEDITYIAEINDDN